MTGESFGESGGEADVPAGSLGAIGCYQLVRVLGRGGMGTVYQATDSRTGEQVALKIMSGRLVQDEGHRKRFEREMAVALLLHHPGITRLFDWGEHKGVPYYVMEYVEGWALDSIPRDVLISLSEHAKAKGDSDRPQVLPPAGEEREHKPDVPFPDHDETAVAREKTKPVIEKPVIALVADLALQAAEALAYAHEQGVIHRDIKPSNLIVTPEGRMRIVDFGLAKAREFETLTTSGDLFGTPAYMSPEQAAGELALIDRRTDVYSLGVTVYHLLTASTPFTGTTRVVTSAILNKDPVEPRRLSRRIPKGLNAIVMKCMEKQREDRYQSAGELVDDLRKFLGGRKVGARQGSLPWRLARILKKRRKAFLLVSSPIFLGAILLLILLVVPSIRSQRYAALIQRATYAAHNESYTAAISFLRQARGWNDTTEVQLMLWDAKGKLERQLPYSAGNRTYAAAFSLTGRLLACGKEDRCVAVWDMTSPESPPRRLKQHKGYVTAVCFSADEKWLASADASGLVNVWDLAEGKRIGGGALSLSGIEAVVDSLAFVEDGSTLFIADTGGNTAILDWGTTRSERRTYESQARLLGSRIYVNQLGHVFAATGVDSGSEKHWAATYEIASGKELISVTLSSGQPTVVAASGSGDQLAVGYPDGGLELYSGDGVGPTPLVRERPRAVRSLVFLGGGSRLLSCSTRGAMEIWDTSRGIRECTISTTCSGVSALAASPQANMAALASVAGGVQLWTIENNFHPSGKLLIPSSLASSAGVRPHCCIICFSHNGDYVASGDSRGSITLWDAETGEEKASITNSTSRVTAMAFSPLKEGLLIYAGRDEALRAMLCIHDIEQNREMHRFGGPGEVVCALAFTPNGRLLAQADRSGHIALRDMVSLEQGKPVRACTLGHVVTALQFDGDMLVTWSTEGVLRFWKRTVRLGLRPINGPRRPPQGVGQTTVAMIPNGEGLAVTTDNARKVGIWYFKNRPKVEFGHQETAGGQVSCLAFSLDQRIIAGGDNDMTVKMWDVQKAREAVCLTTEPETPMSLAFDRASSKLAVGTTNGRVFLYRFP